MNKILSIKDYNAKAFSKYMVAVNNAMKDSHDNLGGIPAKSHYVFDKTTGYVVVIGSEAKYFSDKKRAQEYLVKIESEK